MDLFEEEIGKIKPLSQGDFISLSSVCARVILK